MTQFIEQGTEQEEVGRTDLVEQMEDILCKEPLTSLYFFRLTQCCRLVKLGVDSENISLQDTQYEVFCNQHPWREGKK